MTHKEDRKVITRHFPICVPIDAAREKNNSAVKCVWESLHSIHLNRFLSYRISQIIYGPNILQNPTGGRQHAELPIFFLHDFFFRDQFMEQRGNVPTKHTLKNVRELENRLSG